MSRISGSEVNINNAKKLIEVTEHNAGYGRSAYYAEGANTHDDLREILNYAFDHGLSHYVSEVSACRTREGSNFSKSGLKKAREGMCQIAKDYIDYEENVIRSFDSKFTEGFETVLRNMKVGEGEDFKSKYYTKDVERDDYTQSRYDIDSANPPKYITKEFMTLDEILDEEGIKNIPTISDYMNTRMSSILEESKKQGIISEEKYLELKDKNDYQSFKEAFGSFYQGSLGEYQYIMGTEDLKWHSAKKFADGVMTAIGVVVLAASVLTLGPLSLPLVLGIGTSVVSIYSVGKASYEFFTEKDWLTGRPLDDQEKWTAGLQAVASMVTLGRGVGLVSGALAKSDSASTLVKSTASFFNSSTVQNVTRVSDYALDLGTGFVSYKYGGKSINEVLWSTGFALGMNAAIDFGTYKNNKIAKTKMGDIDQAKTNMGEIDLAKMSDEDLMKYLKENNLSFSDLMSIEDDVIRYNKWTQQVSAGLSMEDRIKINGWNYSPDTDLYLKYKGVYDNPDYFNQLTGDVIYPGMNGNIHTNGFYYGVSMNGSLDEGMIIDRFGGIYGNYTSPDGMPFEQRALPPFSEGAEYHRYKVLVSFEVEMGPIAPWFNQPGLGTQYLSDYTIEELLDLGWIVEVFD